jgi:hypothetical protein
MTAFNECDVVRLRIPIPERGLHAGARGAVLMVFAKQQPAAYEVEFLNADGATLALLTLPESALRKDDGV